MVDHATRRATYTCRVVEDINNVHKYLEEGQLNRMTVIVNLPPFFMGTRGGAPPPTQTNTVEEDPSEESSALPMALQVPTPAPRHDPISIQSITGRVMVKRDPLRHPIHHTIPHFTSLLPCQSLSTVAVVGVDTGDVRMEEQADQREIIDVDVEVIMI